ncbi:chitinase-3-like protein 1 [Haemaphysalis longicornis]
MAAKRAHRRQPQPSVLANGVRASRRPIMTLGAIVPSDFAKLANFDVADLEAQVDWLVAKTHGFFPAPKYNYTSCPSPYEQPDGPRKNLSVMGVLDYHLAMLGQRMNLSRFCFTVSFRATGYKVTGGSMDYRMAVRGPGNLNRYTGDDGILAYNQLCKRVYQSRNSTSDLCSYVYVREDQTWAAFESPWSIAAKVDKVRSYLGSQVSPPANQFCVGVWDLDLDDYRPKCSKSKKWPLLEALVAALP